MFSKSDFKILKRMFLKHKYYSLVNILELVVGVFCALLIYVYVYNEINFDKFHDDYESIYRINLRANLMGKDVLGAHTPPPLAELLTNEFPEVKSSVRLYELDEVFIFNNSDFFKESSAYAVDTNFFEFFSFELINGDPKTVFANQRSMVLTEDAAHKYFGKTDVLGETLSVGDSKQPFIITGICKNVPKNSHIQFNVLVDITSNASVENFSWSWVWSKLYTYVKLNENNSSQEFEKKLTAVSDERVRGTFKFIGISFDSFQEEGGVWEFTLQPLSRIHLFSSEVEDKLSNNGNIVYIIIFSVIGIAILIISCSNYSNLSTARSSLRSKEIGVRKVFGAVKENLLGQLLSESIVTSLLATLIAVILIYVFLPGFNQIINRDLSVSLFSDERLFFVALPIAIAVGVLSGAYPSFYLTSFNIVNSLYGNVSAGLKGNKYLRNTLIILQFSIAYTLIVGTIFVHKQLQKNYNTDLGFKKNNILVVHNLDKIDHQELLKNEVTKIPVVSEASLTSALPSFEISQTFFNQSFEGKEENHVMAYIRCDKDFLKTLKINLFTGRNFSEDSDEQKIIINQSAMNLLRWENPVGNDLLNRDDNRRYEIIGVVEDFNYQDLKKEVEPLIILYSPRADFLAINTTEDNVDEVVSRVESTWQSIYQSVPFEYSFLSDDFNRMFKNEIVLNKLIVISCIIALMLSFLGIVGLASYSANQRSKEMAIHKLLGASNAKILILLNKDFMIMVIFSAIVSAPLSYFMIGSWISQFVYQTSISIAPFLLTTLLILMMTFVTVSLHSLKIIFSNLSKVLREG